MRTMSCIVLAATLFCTQGFSRGTNKSDHAKDENTFVSNICMAKGGIGIITKNLHVNLKSAKNELILSAGERWTGQGVPTPEVVFLSEGRIWSSQALPDGFDLSKTVVVSFGQFSGAFHPQCLSGCVLPKFIRFSV